MTLKTKLLTIFISIALVPMLFIGTIIYSNAKENITNEVLSKLELIASLKEDQISTVINQNFERLSGVTSRTQLRNSLYNYNINGNQVDLDKIDKIVEDAKNSIPDFLELAVVSLDGEIVSFASDVPTKIDSIDPEVIERGQEEPDVFIVVEEGDAVLYLTGPLFFENENIGSIVIQVAPNNLLEITKAKEELTETFDIPLALRAENGDAVFITAQRFKKDEKARSIIPKEELNIPMTQALLKNESVFVDSIDYRGEEVMAATRYIDDQDWGLVVKIDKSESLGPILKLQRLALFIGLITLTIVTFIATFISRSISNPIQNLTRISDDISRGKLDSEIDKENLTSKDEIGDLARAFDRIVASLKVAMLQKKDNSNEDAVGKIAEVSVPPVETPVSPVIEPPAGQFQPPMPSQAPVTSPITTASLSKPEGKDSKNSPQKARK